MEHPNEDTDGAMTAASDVAGNQCRKHGLHLVCYRVVGPLFPCCDMT